MPQFNVSQVSMLYRPIIPKLTRFSEILLQERYPGPLRLTASFEDLTFMVFTAPNCGHRENIILLTLGHYLIIQHAV